MGLSPFLSFLAFILISKQALAGFVQDNQNIFLGKFAQSAPISYQSFINYDKFSTPARNSFDVDHSLNGRSKSVNQLSKSLFKLADFDDTAAYEEEVENAHRIALVKRHNDSDAAYVEAYTEAVQAQRKASRLNQFDFDSEHRFTRAESRSDSNYYQNRYEDVATGEYNSNYNNDGNYEFTKSVGYIVPSDYEFGNGGGSSGASSSSGVVHHQSDIASDQTEIQFAPAQETLRHQ